MGIQIRVKNEIEYGDMLRSTNIYEIIKDLKSAAKLTTNTEGSINTMY